MGNTITYKDWNIEEITGYKPQTTFYMDFSIADNFGNDAIKDTYNREFENWKDNYIYLTEFVLALNWKIWEWYEQDEERARLYNGLWEKVRKYAERTLKGEELNYYYMTTD